MFFEMLWLLVNLVFLLPAYFFYSRTFRTKILELQSTLSDSTKEQTNLYPAPNINQRWRNYNCVYGGVKQRIRMQDTPPELCP